MNWFQLVSLPVVGGLMVYSAVRLVRGDASRRIALLSTLVWLAAFVAIARPELTTRLAGLLGIGRGADLVLYILVLLFFVLCFYIYRRLQQLECAITAVVRHLAIQEGLQRWPPPAESAKAKNGVP